MGFSESEAEKHVEHLLPVQRRTIAEAALAGVSFFGHVRQVRPWARKGTQYSVGLPGGALLHDRDGLMLFEDKYEAAVAALAYLNKVPGQERAKLVGFDLDKENEQ